jgi:hypothetical protein
MKKRFAFIAVVIALVSLYSPATFARTVTMQEAGIIADIQLIKLEKTQEFSLKSVREIKSNGLPLAYAFDLNPRGYIVVSASTSLEPVLAYSCGSNFGDMTGSNPLFELITADLVKRMAFASSCKNSFAVNNENIWTEMLNKDFVPESNPLFEQWPATGDGWLKTNWTQSAPYNDFCPLDPIAQQRSLAGCPATAMAQIMNFHQTMNNTRFDDNDDYFHNYAGAQYFIDDDFETLDFPSFPELNIYLDTLDAHYLNGFFPTNEDKAALTFACAVATKSVFSAQGSGTFGVSQAYDAYVRFGCSTVDLLDSNDADLYDRLKQNIKDTLPAHLAIVDPTWSIGHNVVVDGYNSDDYYHLNFGWGGSYNGWYLIPQEIPYELTVIEGVVVDIMETTIGIKAPETVVSEIFISPNPAKDVTYLNYKLNHSSKVTVYLFTISGQEIMKMDLKDQAPGKYSLPVKLSDQPAGIYFYTLQTYDGLSSGKIVRVE